MAKVMLGDHAAVRVPRAEKDRIRRFYRDVLGCEIIREGDQKDDFRLGGTFYIAFLYEDEGAVLAEDAFLKAIYLELKSDDVEEQARPGRCVAFGVNVLDVPSLSTRISPGTRGPSTVSSSSDAGVRASELNAHGLPVREGVEQAEPVGGGRGLAAAGHAELAEDVGHVHAGGLGRDEQLGGDLAVAAPGRDQPEHLELPRGEPEPVRLGRRGAAVSVSVAIAAERDPGPPGEQGDVVGSAAGRRAAGPARRRGAAGRRRRRGRRRSARPRRTAAGRSPADRAGRPPPTPARLRPRRPRPWWPRP